MASKTLQHHRVSLYDQPMSVRFILFHHIFKAQIGNIPAYVKTQFGKLSLPR